MKKTFFSFLSVLLLTTVLPGNAFATTWFPKEFTKGDRARAVSAYKRAENLGDTYDNVQDAIKKYLATPYDPREKQTTAVK